MNYNIGDRVHVTNITVEGHDRSWIGEVKAVRGTLVRVTMPGKPRDYPFGWASASNVTLMVGAQYAMPLLMAA